MADPTKADAKTGAQPQGSNTNTEDKTPEQRAEASNETQFFDHTIAKINADGEEVLSDHLMPGERRAGQAGDDDQPRAARKADKDAANKDAAKK